MTYILTRLLRTNSSSSKPIFTTIPWTCFPSSTRPVCPPDPLSTDGNGSDDGVPRPVIGWVHLVEDVAGVAKIAVVESEEAEELGGSEGVACASLDGDADQLVYFTVLSNSDGRINLVDGDKMLSLFALFINEQLSILNEAKDENVDKDNKTRVGVVQTAYANGASTDFLKQLGIEVVFTPTGVKYLHEKAAEYDIGIYFEANGHGTVLFSENFLCRLEGRISELSSTSKGSEQQKAVLRLLAVKVVDRTAVVTANAETVVVRPLGIQEAINAETAVVKGWHLGSPAQTKCFVLSLRTSIKIKHIKKAEKHEKLIRPLFVSTIPADHRSVVLRWSNVILTKRSTIEADV
ncbi:hypothetical protein RJ639_012855 [Escallonia herrerae]|uniref:Phosphoacetylglucosamine mutase n=1 Tax=Escallonia herrerae TaxID=1293975 RepID=A0AA88VQG2_9ASTE|nr:hypothetical protein RJ639_012855 [Escallonia herrerae]